MARNSDRLDLLHAYVLHARKDRENYVEPAVNRIKLEKIDVTPFAWPRYYYT